MTMSDWPIGLYSPLKGRIIREQIAYAHERLSQALRERIPSFIAEAKTIEYEFETLAEAKSARRSLLIHCKHSLEEIEIIPRFPHPKLTFRPYLLRVILQS